MLIDHPDSLHERMADRRPDEPEPSALEVLANGIAVRRRCRDPFEVQRPAAQHLAVRELPDVIAEGAGAVAQLEVAARVGDEGVHLEPISHDAGIAQQALALYGIVAGHRFSIEVVERGTIARALAQDGEPAQARLRALQTQHFEQMTVIMDGHAPLGIMIGDVERIRGAPRAAQLAVRMTLNRCHDPAQSDVQPHGVAILVDELDAVDAPRAPRRAANLVHQLEKHPGIDFRGCGQARLDAEMQHHESLVRPTHEHRDAQWPAGVRYREQRLNPFDVADADAQAALVLKDLRYPIGLNGLLNSKAYSMLVDIEKEQLFERGPLFDMICR